MTDPARVAVVGAGGIGVVLAAALRRAGHRVTLCARTPVDRVMLTAPDGARAELDVPVRTDPTREPPADWVVLATKAQDTASAEPWLAALVDERAAVLVAQNGIGHEQRVRSLVGTARVLPAVLYVSAERTGPGQVRHVGGDRVLLPAGELADRAVALFAGGGLDVTAVPDFTTAAWRKLVSNAGANPITALTGRRLDVLTEPGVLRLADRLLTEAVAVARADGASLDERDVRAVLDSWRDYPADGGTSMLYDRLAGRPMEHEFITGAVVAAADRHGVPVPANETVLELLRALR